jgi:predicted O-methyltransferase YrrM
MIKFSKELVKRLPKLRRVFAERDQLRTECARLRSERDVSMSERYELFLKSNQLNAQCGSAQDEARRLALENESLRRERDQALAEKNHLLKSQWVPPGHYYSPIPDLDELKSREREIWGKSDKDLPGIDFNEQEQLGLFRAFRGFYSQFPAYQASPEPSLRYYYENGYFPYSDALYLYCMMRYLRPRRIIEVGSGYSSCVMLDTNERFFDYGIACTFVEPYPQRLKSLMRPGDCERVRLVEKKLQEVDLDLFRELEARDILFIDSTHVVKTGSDVNHILFEVLPALRRGVTIHIHDVWHPFEYPMAWVYMGRTWNEDYLLRAFLQYNHAFKIQFFDSYLRKFHQQEFPAELPLVATHGGASIWLRKV